MQFVYCNRKLCVILSVFMGENTASVYSYSVASLEKKLKKEKTQLMLLHLIRFQC